MPVEKVLQKSVMLSTRWPVLAHSMEISPLVVADIRRNMATDGGTMYALQTTLEAWVSKCGPSKATFAQLIKIVKSLELNEITGNSVLSALKILYKY